MSTTIKLKGRVDVKRLSGKINLVPSASSGGPLQAKTVYPSHSEQAIAPDEDYYGLAVVTVKPVPRVPVAQSEFMEGMITWGEFFEEEMDISVEHSIEYKTITYSYYRLTITDFRRSGAQSQFASAVEFALYDANGKNLALSDGTQTYSASSESSSSETADKAFDGNNSTMWHSNDRTAPNTTNWLQVKIRTPESEIIGFGIMPRSGYNDWPWKFTLDVSDDGVEWNTIYTHNGDDTGWAQMVERLFFIESGQEYFLYNGVKLPKIPNLLLAKYPYCCIRISSTKTTLICSVNGFYFNDTAVWDKSSAMLKIYTLENDAWVENADSLKYTGWTVISSGVLQLEWSNHDIPNGSADATEIYFAGSEPVPV